MWRNMKFTIACFFVILAVMAIEVIGRPYYGWLDSGDWEDHDGYMRGGVDFNGYGGYGSRRNGGYGGELGEGYGNDYSGRYDDGYVGNYGGGYREFTDDSSEESREIYHNEKFDDNDQFLEFLSFGDHGHEYEKGFEAQNLGFDDIDGSGDDLGLEVDYISYGDYGN